MQPCYCNNGYHENGLQCGICNGGGWIPTREEQAQELHDAIKQAVRESRKKRRC